MASALLGFSVVYVAFSLATVAGYLAWHAVFEAFIPALAIGATLGLGVGWALDSVISNPSHRWAALSGLWTLIVEAWIGYLLLAPALAVAR